MPELSVFYEDGERKVNMGATFPTQIEALQACNALHSAIDQILRAAASSSVKWGSTTIQAQS